MDKLGSWIELKAGLVVDGGNKAMHGVNSGVRFNTSSASMQLETIDAGASPHNMDYPRTRRPQSPRTVIQTRLHEQVLLSSVSPAASRRLTPVSATRTGPASQT